jgi:predicted aldo/keto reductase-like oxidoreductase
MYYKDFNTTTRISRLAMGAMRLPTTHGEPGAPIDYEKAQAIVDYAYENGVNYFDTAYIYHGGESEKFLGKALSKYPRDSYYLADKFNLQANPNFIEQFREQLTRLNTDYIDFYLIHGIQDPSLDTVAKNGCISYFEHLKEEGKIKHLGFSFHGSPAGFKRMVAMHKWDFVMIQLNYYDWTYGDAKELYEILEKENIPVMVMEPLRGGKLATLSQEAEEILKKEEPEKSVASWAMRWLMDLPQVAVVLSGMSDIRQAEDNIKTFKEYKPLNINEKKVLHEACEVYRPTVAVACTDCRYCTDDCPMGLDIPRIIGVYNEVKLDHIWRLSFLGNLPENKRPNACTACGICKTHCPQGLDIPAHMAELNEMNKQMESMMKKND